MKCKIVFILSFIIGIIIILNLNTVNAATTGKYEYNELQDGTVEITGYVGTETELSVPSTLDGKKVSKIGQNAFYKNKTITKVTIPSTVTSIEIAAFEHCTSLRTIILPDSVQEIGNYSFAYDSNLNSVTLGKNLKRIGASSFMECTSLKSINIPDAVEEIGISAFDSTLIESIKLPKNLKELGWASFSQCSNLKEITLAEGNTSFVCEDGVIYNITKTELIYYMPSKTNETYIMPNTVKKIYNEAFRDTKNLKNITLSSKLETIGNSAFRNSGITAIELPNTISSLERMCFESCSNLKTLVIRGTLEGIPYNMCSDCTSLSSVIFEDCKNLYSFSDYAFEDCTSLVSIKLPETIEIIGSYCFSDCTNLTTVEINDSINLIENKWNYNCPKLTNYKIPDGLVKLANGDYRRLITITLNNPNNYYSYGDAWKVLDIVNKYRKENGLSELTMDTDLLENAMLRAQETSVLFSHTRPDGSDCETVVTNKASMLGENIAAGSTSAESVMSQWMDSPTHKSNILGSKYKSIGIGCYKVGNAYYWVQIFSSNEGKAATRSDETINKTVKQNIAYSYYDNIGVTTYKSKLTGKEITAYETEDTLIGTIGDTWTPEETWIENWGWKGAVNYFATTDAKWTSSNEKVLKVSSDGTIELVGYGIANITMELGNVARTYKIQVTLPFKDVKSTDWYYNAVEYTYRNGIISGATETEFRPNAKITRGMIVTILWRMEGSPKVTGVEDFTDVTGQYYYDAVRWAAKNGVVNGYGDGRFGPNANITREQLATILCNYAKYKKKNTNVTVDISKYKDWNKVSSFAKPSIQWAIKTGVVTGKENGTKVDPQGTATRGEAACMIYNYCTKIK